jgi:hypothetical protein
LDFEFSRPPTREFLREPAGGVKIRNPKSEIRNLGTGVCVAFRIPNSEFRIS